jgi:hypothetical protein
MLGVTRELEVLVQEIDGRETTELEELELMADGKLEARVSIVVLNIPSSAFPQSPPRVIAARSRSGDP